MNGEANSIKAHSGLIRDIAISPNGSIAITGGEDQLVKVWDLLNFRQSLVLRGYNSPINEIAFQPENDNIFYVFDDNHNNYVFDLNQGKIVENNPGEISIPKLIKSTSPNSERMILTDELDYLCLYGEGQEKIKILEKIPSTGSHIRFSANGERFTTFDCLRVNVWNSADGIHINYIGPKLLEQYDSFGPNEKLPKNLRDEQIEFYRMMKITISVSNQGPSCVDISPDGRRVITGQHSTNNVVLWEAFSGKEIAHLKGHKEMITSITFTPDGKNAISGDAGGNLFIWKLPL
jgi:WD40 repeat protein